MDIITYIEYAPSDKSHCRGCEKRILRRFPRGVMYITIKQHQTKHFYCWKCSKLKLLETIKYLGRQIKELSILVSSREKEILEEESRTP